MHSQLAQCLPAVSNHFNTEHEIFDYQIISALPYVSLNESALRCEFCQCDCSKHPTHEEGRKLPYTLIRQIGTYKIVQIICVDHSHDIATMFWSCNWVALLQTLSSNELGHQHYTVTWSKMLRYVWNISYSMHAVQRTISLIQIVNQHLKIARKVTHTWSSFLL